MGAKTSAEMLAARSLLWRGLSASDAAKEAGIGRSAISMSQQCQLIIAAVRDAVEVLATDAEPSDAELLVYFTDVLCIPEDHAKFHIARRAELLKKESTG